MSKTLLFTSSKGVNQIKKIRKNENGEIIIIALNYAAKKGLQKESIPFNTLEKYVTNKDYEENIKKTIKWIKNWPNIKSINGKSFKEFVTYQNFSLWWSMEIPLFFEFKLSDITWEIKKIKNAINIEKPQKIIIAGSSNLYKEIVLAIGNSRGIPTISIEPAITLNNVRYFVRFLRPYLMWYAALARDFIRKYLAKIINSIFKSEKKKLRHEKNKIIIVSQRRGWQTTPNLKSREKRKVDVYYDSLIKELLKNKENDILLIDGGGSLGLKILLEKMFSSDIRCNPIEAYFSIQAKEKGKFLLDIWKDLNNNNTFKNSLIFDEVPIWNLMKDIFHLFFTLRFIRLIQHIEGVKQMIKLEKPSIIIMTNDIAQGYSFPLIGKTENVPTLAIQHGVIGYLAIDFVNAEGGPTDVVNPLWRPIVDKLAVFGDYYKDIFVDYGSYSPDKVVVTGQPKSDYLARADEIFDKNKLCNKLGMNPNEKIIVWTTQTHGLKLNENRKNVSCVYNTVKLLKNIQLIIKLHPDEDQKAPLYKENKLIKPMIIAAKDVDTNEVLYGCDAMITRSSTTALDAMILNKLVIILNLSSQSDYVPYAESGAAIGVYKEEDLLPILKKVLDDPRFKEKVEKNRKKFVYDHAYIQDGKASKRVADLITQMIEDAKEGNNEKRI